MTQKKLKVSSKNTKSDLLCTFCKREFVREKSFLNHLCEKKKRYLERDTKYFNIAFQAYDTFLKVSCRRKSTTTDHFITSTTYKAFISFGKYVLDINAVSPQDYVDYLIKNKTPIDDWVKDRVYEGYVRNLALKESPDRAVERNIILMESWANDTGKLIKDFFREISPGLAIQWIRSGRISPWVLFNCASGVELLQKFSDEQLMIGGEALNKKLWQGKFSRHLEYVYEIQDRLAEVGL